MSPRSRILVTSPVRALFDLAHGCDDEREIIVIAREVCDRASYPMEIVAFAQEMQDAPGASDVIALCQDALIARGDVSAIYHFARLIPGADVARLQEIVIASDKPYVIAQFATKIPGADIALLHEALLESEDEGAIALFNDTVDTSTLQA